ncbi:uncharacterized protein BX663DRAFT_510123 [Cokeromyces recurvatus]|uniref:uncharacterized protein n=1 Tax=Cokeromyces recurvatus TaxID=90255 RepID=UPI00221F338E|nr:uncharacterized protein BX663DRAFT_510123 [Cokeromyces recurvatus]KAI7902680.1 hypothetical protein BX663DRAFT_510123 [Cokeromyces recurvatus]
MNYNNLVNTLSHNDLVDERWDDDFDYYYSEAKGPKLDVLFQNLTMNHNQQTTKEVSGADKEKKEMSNDDSLNTICFKEDITPDDEDQDKQIYFNDYPTIEINLATPSTTPSMIEEEEDYDYLTTTQTQPNRTTKKEEEGEDFSIIPLNEFDNYDELNEELMLNECVTIKPQEVSKETNKKDRTPLNLYTYHSSLVQYYMDIILHKTDPLSISSQVSETLPNLYKNYIQKLRDL